LRALPSARAARAPVRSLRGEHSCGESLLRGAGRRGLRRFLALAPLGQLARGAVLLLLAFRGVLRARHGRGYTKPGARRQPRWCRAVTAGGDRSTTNGEAFRDRDLPLS